MKATIAQFIPIILILIMLTYSKEFVQFSHSILGKVMAIALVLFYTHLDKYVGVVLCLFVIVYYQSDFVENMLNTDDIMNEMAESVKESTSGRKVDDFMPNIDKIQGRDQKQTSLSESMSNLSDVYPTIEHMEHDNEPSKQQSVSVVNAFRKENCNGIDLMYKDMKVKPDMIGHIFPNVEFKDGECNVCDSTCKFSIIENRLKTETELFRSEFQEGKRNKYKKKPRVTAKPNKFSLSTNINNAKQINAVKKIEDASKKIDNAVKRMENVAKKIENK
jgi:hypothetical protein